MSHYGAPHLAITEHPIQTIPGEVILKGHGHQTNTRRIMGVLKDYKRSVRPGQ